MRPFFLYSDFGDSLFLALRLQEEGARVQFHVHQPQGKYVGRGLVPLANEREIPSNAVVIFDATKYGKQGAELRRRGHLVIGGNALDEPLEINRTMGATIMGEAGISIPETHPFTEIREAIAFLEDEEGKWYMKLSGDTGTAKTYNARRPDMMIRYLTWLQKQPGEKPAFELQRAVDGVEVSCEGWFDGKKFVPPFNATLETKKFMAGDVGPRTGCESNVVYLLEGRRPKLPARGVARLEGLLRRKGYVGPIDLNQIVTPADELYGLEWSARLGFDAAPAYSRFFKGNLAEQLEAFAAGELTEWELADVDQVAMTIRISVPPYPNDNTEDAAAELRGLPLDSTLFHDDRITLTDVMLGDDREPAFAGRDGHLGTIGSTGPSMKRLRRELVEIADNLDVPWLQYRKDPIERAEKDMKALDALDLLHHTPLSLALLEDGPDEPEDEDEDDEDEAAARVP